MPTPAKVIEASGEAPTPEISNARGGAPTTHVVNSEGDGSGSNHVDGSAPGHPCPAVQPGAGPGTPPPADPGGVATGASGPTSQPEEGLKEPSVTAGKVATKNFDPIAQSEETPQT